MRRRQLQGVLNHLHLIRQLPQDARHEGYAGPLARFLMRGVRRGEVAKPPYS